MLEDMDQESRRKFARRFFTDAAFCEIIVNRGNGMTAAQFSEMCNQECLNKNIHLKIA